MSEPCINMIDLFNSLSAKFVSGDISEAKFRKSAQQGFGYSDQEMRIIMKRIRRERSLAVPSAGSPAGVGG
ncbi:hypothetical protein ABIA94_006286 [Bradyrhizobium sp. LA7.1]